MPQIAQQDYIYLEIGDFENLTPDEKKELRKAVANNTILDYVITYHSEDGINLHKVVGYSAVDAIVLVGMPGSNASLDISE